MNSRIENLQCEMRELCRIIDRPVRIMEVCGTHTVSAFRSGLRSLLPQTLRLISGPGCPVCVTAQRHIDAALELATRDNLVIATYGDMLTVPGRNGSLEWLRGQGASILVVNSARTALKYAREHPDQTVAFLAVGFETTAPATAATVLEADRDRVRNFTVLMCHKLVVPAMLALLEAGDVRIDGFLCPGHVSVIIGSRAYRPVVHLHHKPCVVAGFEYLQMLLGLVHLLRQIAGRRALLENVYPAVVSELGNATALSLMRRAFVAVDTPWRSLQVIPKSGLDLAPHLKRYDAVARFGLQIGEDEDHPACRCGEVIQGKAEPADCPLFDRGCTPLSPIGPCMVSSEGTCAAWYRYGGSRHHDN